MLILVEFEGIFVFEQRVVDDADVDVGVDDLLVEVEVFDYSDF